MISNALEIYICHCESFDIGQCVFLQLSQKRFYEKPTKKRERLEYEKCNRLYNKEMRQKIEFVMKQHDPLPPL